MSDKKPRLFRISVAAIISLLIFGLAGWLLFNRQYVADVVSVWAYAPDVSIQTLSDRVDFSDEGEFHFYATHPQIASAASFNQNCQRQESTSPILGCYSMGRIYIYDITNEQLEGIEEVTAAHEMLHAVWERMDPKEQERVGSLLRAEYAELADPELEARMEYYSRTEPGQLENELHSIIGTEIRTINPALEAYYGKYFNDRAKVLAFHDAYSTVFTGLKTRADALFNELVALGQSVGARSAQYNASVAQLSADIASFNSRANNGGFSSVAQFNNERAALVARSNQLEADRASINADITTYNNKYEEYQSVADQIVILNKSIDSLENLTPAPEVQ